MEQALLGNDINIFFDRRKLRESFNLNKSLTMHTVLDPKNPSDKFKTLGEWIVALEDIVFKIVEAEMKKPDWKNYNYFFYKRKDTLNSIWSEILSDLAGAYGDRYFPEPANNNEN